MTRTDKKIYYQFCHNT